jgi:hypothetical protein
VVVAPGVEAWVVVVDVVGEVAAVEVVVVVRAVAVLVTVAWVGVVVVVVDTLAFLLTFDTPLKKVVGCPLPVIELPARRSGTVKTPTTIANAARPVRRTIRQRGRQSSRHVPPGAGAEATLGALLAVAATACIGRRKLSETSAMITGAAAAPKRVPGPQICATAYDAAADARLAMIRVCNEIPLRELCSFGSLPVLDTCRCASLEAAPARSL